MQMKNERGELCELLGVLPFSLFASKNFLLSLHVRPLGWCPFHRKKKFINMVFHQLRVPEVLTRRQAFQYIANLLIYDLLYKRKLLRNYLR